MLRAFVLKVAQRMKAAQLEMILVIPPMRYTSERQMSTFFDRKDFDVLKKEIAFFSIMTYDFSSRPGPNAPINWTRAAIEMLVPENITAERNKILVGLNFYGYDYSPTNTRALVNTEYSAIVHNEALDLACKWSHEYREMEFRYKVHNEIHEMWYPTPNSVRARIDLSRELNVGISIWEIGQGIEPFYDYL
ncbi:hypothetical protein SARC_06607 [Sphaeroforma arctica JP610]|uniref:Chitinase domain-containing protein 1 n=1 Tax=Sphaeroforma arctica JP610 TaxID=667725 RepID=A0A0L0FWV9_9EUKA|nr:hypothetical protein SARC_06607 [Sphaeroforma arctica JP610]KNC81046.1 hypothetical protein SARC_06607 [Sphaeroforma arctica JP610]|eukprot:XP_014154948.1 hypothetical protein SARC_06607 [Sphaeroforma arctica JP610]